jgi:hypothetical protein
LQQNVPEFPELACQNFRNPHEYMKDIWRNELSHTRRRYNKAESLAVINRVRDFVQLIASHEVPKEIDERIARLERIKKSLLSSAIYTRLDMELRN